eukprot:TRINITY_DN3417_c0_g2_i1.p1 TRINITY_DN3417_c0_g2~~TRINITY_DN3417_c0_g2_i1.p1  ORF type:complete len:1106 (-),score=214.78 TRINITY_DN3417_c0_g2_i1:112-3429(-)
MASYKHVPQQDSLADGDAVTVLDAERGSSGPVEETPGSHAEDSLQARASETMRSVAQAHPLKCCCLALWVCVASVVGMYLLLLSVPAHLGQEALAPTLAWASKTIAPELRATEGLLMSKHRQPVQLPPVPNLLQAQDLLTRPLLPAPAGWLPRFKNLSKMEREARNHYWKPAMLLAWLSGSLLTELPMLLRTAILSLCSSHSKDSSTELEEQTAETTLDEPCLPTAVAALLHAGHLIFCMLLVKLALDLDVLNQTYGLAWELWLLWLMCTFLDAFLQSCLRALTAPATASIKFGNAMSKAAMMPVPLVSERTDTLKDCIFMGLCFQAKEPVLGACTALTLTVTSVCIYARPDLREDMREEHLPLLIPAEKNPPGSLYAALYARVFSLLHSSDRDPGPAAAARAHAHHYFGYKAAEAAKPSKYKLAILEDLPQAFLQTIFALRHGGSPFIMASVVISIIKVLCVPLLHRYFAYGGGVERLIRKIKYDGEAHVRREAMQAFKKTCRKTLRQGLVPFLERLALNDADAKIRLLALQCLSGYSWGRGATCPCCLWTERDNSMTLATFRAVLNNDADAELRDAAAAHLECLTLGQLQEVAAEMNRSLLEEENETVRLAVLRAFRREYRGWSVSLKDEPLYQKAILLARLGLEHAVSADHSEKIRQKANDVLERNVNSDTLADFAPFMSALILRGDSPYPEGRRMALSMARSLPEQNKQQLVDQVALVLADGNSSDESQLRALEGLRYLGAVEGISEVVSKSIISAKYSSVRSCAVDVLGMLPQALLLVQLPLLLSVSEADPAEEVRARCMHVLGAMAREQAKGTEHSALQRLENASLSDSTASVRKEAIRAVRNLYGLYHEEMKKALFLKVLLSDPDDMVKEEAAGACASLSKETRKQEDVSLTLKDVILSPASCAAIAAQAAAVLDSEDVKPLLLVLGQRLKDANEQQSEKSRILKLCGSIAAGQGHDCKDLLTCFPELARQGETSDMRSAACQAWLRQLLFNEKVDPTVPLQILEHEKDGEVRTKALELLMRVEPKRIGEVAPAVVRCLQGDDCSSARSAAAQCLAVLSRQDKTLMMKLRKIFDEALASESDENTRQKIKQFRDGRVF